MENIAPTLGVEDGITEVDCLLVEPQGGHVSMDSILCFDKTIPHNAMCMKDASPSFAQSNTGTAHEGGDIFSGEVLDEMHTETEVGYFRLQNDYCTMGEDYFLGVEFADSVAYLDSGSSEGLHASVSDCSILTSSADPSMPWKSECLRIREVPEYQNDQLNISSSEFSEIPCFHEGESLAEEKSLTSPKSSALQNFGKFQDVWSSCFFQDVLSDVNDGRLSPSGEIFCSSEILQDGQDLENNRILEHESLPMTAAHVNRTDALPAIKRPRKPTQRYIDEFANTLSRHPTRKREFSTLSGKDKSLGVNNDKKCHVKSRAIRLLAEDSSVQAIQVPFGSLMQKESQKNHAFYVVPKRYVIGESKEYCITRENQKKGNSIIAAVHKKRRDDFTVAARQTERADCDTEAHPAETDDYHSEGCLKKNDKYATQARSTKKGDYFTDNCLKKCDDHFIIAARQKKRDDSIPTVNPKKRDVRVTTSLQKKDNFFRAARHKKKDGYYSTESPEEVNRRRKHHRLWTISEVRKLIDGVSQHGVGRWSRIKKLFFPTSPHRTSVDIKDKWRNLLKASGIQERNKRQGEKRRNMAWRPLPKPIMRRVCELAIMYPYPKGQKPEIAHFHRIFSDGSTDITLRDYIRMIKSNNGN